MAQEQDEDLVRVLDGENPPWILGSEKFICWIKDRFFKKKKDTEVPASKELAPDVDTIISEVSRYYELRPAARCGHLSDSIRARRAADKSRSRFWLEPIQFGRQRGYARKDKVAKG